MNVLVKVISTSLNDIGRRIVKFYGFSKEDVRTAMQAAPFGIDSNPPKNMIAVYAATAAKGKAVIIGYINKDQLAGPGETRLFSVNEDGLATYIWIKADGTIEFGGDNKFLVSFAELKTGFDQLKSDFNGFLTHVHGGSGTPPAPPYPASTASIDDAKLENIKG